MANRIQAIRGMNDLLPDVSPGWRQLEQTLINVLDSYGYQEIRLPIVEKTEVFARVIGEHTDIVSKEMYSFADRNGEMLTLRPEGTAGCVRAGLQHGLFHNQIQRLWYLGPMFRHERPQKGRYRQFHQLGVEACGMPGPDIDAELILLCRQFWQQLGLDNLQLELNSLGSSESRSAYRAVLVDYFSAHREQLDDDSRLRLEHNPLRILDSKNPAMQDLLAGAPVLAEHLDAESRAHFDGLCEILTAVGVEFVVNPRLVRGLDYYNHTVFEWTTDRLGAQATVCAGGRYDRLIEQVGGQPTPAIGFAIGLERLLELVAPAPGPIQPQIYLITGATATADTLQLADELRREMPGLRVVTHCGGGSLKSQFKRADRYGALLALILADDELARGCVTVKPLRGQGEQQSIPRAAAVGYVKELLAQAVLPDH